MTKLIKGISLFSGGGLMDMGAEMAGIHTAYANELEPKFAAYHAANFKHPDGTPVVSVKSIRELTKEDILKVLEEKYGDSIVDVVCGGPVCCDYSRLNSRKRTGLDSRNWLVMEFLSKISILQPRVAVMEQIPQFLTDDFYFPLFQEAIGKMNYVVKYKVLCALNYEGNSIRRRAIFIFVRKDLGKMPVFPKPIPEGVKMCGEFLDIDAFTSGHFDDRLRLSDEPMTTVTGGSPQFFFKNGISRRPSEREIMLCQSLDPDRYILPESHSYSVFRKVLGNGVPTLMAFHVFKTIMDEILNPVLDIATAADSSVAVVQ